MKRLIYILLALLIASALAPEAAARKKAATSFAIITDSTTWAECSTELEDYRNVLEQEGLATYIIADNWDDPMALRERIISLAGQKPALEGIVLVGDVPIVMVREGQHLTTAFKMDEERYPIFKSSVASDRFYDDFDLEFEFLCRDTVRNDVFYYRLSETGEQTLRPDIYSARMKVPGVMEGDKYAILRAYLKKVVAAHREQNSLDNMTYFAGHGYNSDCLTVWRQKPMVFRENFPCCFEKSSTNRFLNFREAPYMEDRLFNELQRDVDFMMFSEHGDFDTQYINSSENGMHSLSDAVSAVKDAVASAYLRYKGTEEEEGFLKEVFDSVYHISREAVSDSALAVMKENSEYVGKKINITLDEIMKLKSNPCVIVFNACYNGSFHREDGYVAGCHVFGPGKCVVAQGNTVNVLQDKWEDKMIGLLSMGERVGMWQKEIAYLESHLIGDPTFRFTPHSKNEAKVLEKLHNDLIFNKDNAKSWEKYLKSDNPVLRATGITCLGYIGAPSADRAALSLLEDDPSWVVKMHALGAIAAMKSPLIEEAVTAGLNSPYEMVARTSIHLAGDICSGTLTDALEEFRSGHPELIRASFAASGALRVIDGTAFSPEVGKISDKSLPEARRRSAMRSFRNSNTIGAIGALLDVVADSSESEGFRRDACEVLGWYSVSEQREAIAAALEEILSDESLPERVRKEITKSIKRLK